MEISRWRLRGVSIIDDGDAPEPPSGSPSRRLWGKLARGDGRLRRCRVLAQRGRDMTGAGAAPGPLGTVSDDYGPGYFDTHLGSDAEYDWDSPEWRTFFTNVADRIVAITNPSSVVDVGCASGLLVQALRERGISCDGIDISAHAIDRASPSVRAHLRVAGAENLVGNWDLVTCIEALEHMSSDAAERAIDVMCRASDRVLVSTTPGNFAEPTHINVREPAAWAAAFAERGFSAARTSTCLS
jgi:SAM-dependent methyltransferase